MKEIDMTRISTTRTFKQNAEKVMNAYARGGKQGEISPLIAAVRATISEMEQELRTGTTYRQQSDISSKGLTEKVNRRENFNYPSGRAEMR